MGKKILIGCAVTGGLALGLFLVASVILGVAMQSGLAPDTEIEIGGSLQEAHRKAARSLIEFEEGESLEWIYGTGLFSYEEGASFMTDRRLVLVKATESGETEAWEMRLEEIVGVEVDREAKGFQDALVRVDGLGEGQFMRIPLSGDLDRHLRVIERLRDIAETNLSLARQAEAAAAEAAAAD